MIIVVKEKNTDSAPPALNKDNGFNPSQKFQIKRSDPDRILTKNQTRICNPGFSHMSPTRKGVKHSF